MCEKELCCVITKCGGIMGKAEATSYSKVLALLYSTYRTLSHVT